MHVLQVDTFKSRIDNQNDTDRTIWNLLRISRPHYRTYEVYFSNFDYEGLQLTLPVSSFVYVGTAMDSFYWSNFTLSNGGSTNDDFVVVQFLKQAIFSNFTFENITENNGLLTLYRILKVEINNLTVRNYKSTNQRTFSELEIASTPESEIRINGLYLYECEFNGLPFLDLSLKPLKFEFINGIYENAQMDGQISLINFKIIPSFIIKNHTFRNIKIIEGDEPLNHFINLVQLEVGNSSDMEIQDVYFDNSDISFLNVDTILSENVEKSIHISNLSVKNTYFSESRSVISTEGFETVENFYLIFDDFTASNISFKTSGEIFNLKHYLKNPVVIRNAVFENLSSANIHSEVVVHQNLHLFTKVKIENSIFKQIQNPLRAFINSKAHGNFDIVSSNFTEVSSISDKHGIIYFGENSIGSFTSCIFTNNSALASPVFKVESKSEIV